MRTDHRIFLVFGFFALFSGMATAQLPALSINPVQTELQRVTILGYQSQTYVNGAPYSAIEESLCSQRLPGNRRSGFPCPALDLTRETRRVAIDGDLGRLARPKTMLLTAAEHTFHCGRAPGVVPMAPVIGGANRLGQVLYLLVDHIGVDLV
jgi:hypothetical protein